MAMTKTNVPTVEPEAGQIYYVKRRDTHYQILYIDDEVVLLRCEDAGRDGRNGNRIERRTAFDNKKEEGWFEYKPDSNLDMMDLREADWSDLDNIGEKAAANMVEAGFETTLDVKQADDEELLDVSWLGKAGLKSLREFVR